MAAILIRLVAVSFIGLFGVNSVVGIVVDSVHLASGDGVK